MVGLCDYNPHGVALLLSYRCEPATYCMLQYAHCTISISISNSISNSIVQQLIAHSIRYVACGQLESFQANVCNAKSL